MDAEGEADAEGEPDEEEVDVPALDAVASPPPAAPLEVDVDMEEAIPGASKPKVKYRDRRAAQAAQKEAKNLKSREKRQAAKLKAAAAELEVKDEGEVVVEGDQVDAGPSVVVVASTEHQEPDRAESLEASTRATRTRTRTSITSLTAPSPPPAAAAGEDQSIVVEEEAPVVVVVEPEPEVEHAGEEAAAVVVEPEVEVENAGEEEVVVVPEKKPSSRKRKRTTSDENMDRDVPLTVAELDNRDTFKMFETGWILPEGSRRGGRTAEPRDRETSPVKTKRARISSVKKVAAAVVEEAGESIFCWQRRKKD